jgi:uncharacterized phage protein (TIGR02218 family)
LWDGASIETWLVDWRNPVRRLLIDTGQIGEITRSGERFTAEIRSLASRFDQDQGRRYEALCSARLGDGQCQVDLSLAGRQTLTSVALISDQTTFSVAAIPALLPGSLTHGIATFHSGSAVPTASPIMSHTRAGSMEIISLWNSLSFSLTEGEAVSLQVGCDKRLGTCRSRFSNALNFRGFPHIPGNDFLLSYARQGDAELDGGVVIQ